MPEQQTKPWTPSQIMDGFVRYAQMPGEKTAPFRDAFQELNRKFPQGADDATLVRALRELDPQKYPFVNAYKSTNISGLESTSAPPKQATPAAAPAATPSPKEPPKPQETPWYEKPLAGKLQATAEKIGKVGQEREKAHPGKGQGFFFGLQQGGLEAGIDLTTPENMALLAGGQIAGRFKQLGKLPKLFKIAEAIGKGGFTASMLSDLAKEAPDAYAAYQRGDKVEAGRHTAKAIVELLSATSMLGSGAGKKFGSTLVPAEAAEAAPREATAAPPKAAEAKAAEAPAPKKETPKEPPKPAAAKQEAKAPEAKQATTTGMGLKKGPVTAADISAKALELQQKAAESRKAQPAAEAAPVGNDKLPQSLAGAKPGFRIGTKNYEIKFGSDLEKAAYIARNEAVKSNRDAEYVKFVRDATGMTEKQVREAGDKIYSFIKSQAEIPGRTSLFVPDLLSEIQKQAKAAPPATAKPKAAAPAKPAESATAGASKLEFQTGEKAKNLNPISVSPEDQKKWGHGWNLIGTHNGIPVYSDIAKAGKEDALYRVAYARGTETHPGDREFESLDAAKKFLDNLDKQPITKAAPVKPSVAKPEPLPEKMEKVTQKVTQPGGSAKQSEQKRAEAMQTVKVRDEWIKKTQQALSKAGIVSPYLADIDRQMAELRGKQNARPGDGRIKDALYQLGKQKYNAKVNPGEVIEQGDRTGIKITSPSGEEKVVWMGPNGETEVGEVPNPVSEPGGERVQVGKVKVPKEWAEKAKPKPTTRPEPPKPAATTKPAEPVAAPKPAPEPAPAAPAAAAPTARQAVDIKSGNDLDLPSGRYELIGPAGAGKFAVRDLEDNSINTVEASKAQIEKYFGKSERPAPPGAGAADAGLRQMSDIKLDAIKGQGSYPTMVRVKDASGAIVMDVQLDGPEDVDRMKASLPDTLKQYAGPGAELLIEQPNIKAKSRTAITAGKTVSQGDQVKAAKERLKKKLTSERGSFSMKPSDSQSFSDDMMLVAKDAMRRVGDSFERWSKEMVATFGRDIRPILKTVWEGTRVGARRIAATWYSPTAKALESKMPNRASAVQVRNIVESMGKADEVEWTGLDDWLEDRKGQQVSKQEVLDFLKRNQIPVIEIEKRSITDEERAFMRRYAERISRGEVLPEEDQYRQDTLLDQFGPGGIAIPKFKNYTLSGGDNYREILFTLPVEYETEPVHIVEFSNKLEDDPQMPGYSTPTRSEIRGSAEYVQQYMQRFAHLGPRLVETIQVPTRKSTKPTFDSSHFDEPNVLAHTRVDDRRDASGARMLFLEEVQSDWHQTGRRVGYFDSQKEQRRFTQIISQYTNVTKLHNRYYRVVNKLGEQEFQWDEGEPIGSGGTTPERATDSAIETLISESRYNKPPYGPFSKSWHELVIKRMLRWAAENGYDKLGWTTGAQQTERYPGDDGLVDRDIKNGMTGFYDKILPDFLNKFGRKWGARVGESEVETDKGTTKVHSITITPEMKRSVLEEGVPIAKRGAPPLQQLSEVTA